MGAMSAALFVVFVLLVEEGAAAASKRLCNDDAMCGASEFCYLRKHCAPCIACSPYNRESKAYCVKEPSHCGNCIDGYEPEVLTDGMTRDLCVPTSSAEPQPQQVMVAGFQWIPYSVIVVALVVLVFLAFYSMQKRVKVSQRTRFIPCDDGSRSTSSDALFAPSAPPTSYADDLKFVDGYAMTPENMQQAAKYLDPQYVRSGNNNNNEIAADEVDGTPENLFIDENTLPSEWTPGPSYSPPETSGSGAPLITSFEGILRLNAAATSSTAGASTSSQSSDEEEPANHSADPNGNPQINVTNITVINTAPSTTGVFNITKT